MEYYENGGGAVAQLSFRSASSAGSSAPASDCNQVGSNSFVGCYYNRTDLINPVMIQNTLSINFNWGNGSPGSGVNADGFSARWQGGTTSW
jgi:hypothetical protein